MKRSSWNKRFGNKVVHVDHMAFESDNGNRPKRKNEIKR
jgi:hypothetical protein